MMLIFLDNVFGMYRSHEDYRHRDVGNNTLKIGPIRASFTGKITFCNIEVLSAYTITGEGQGGAAGFAKGGAKVQLNDIDGGTLLVYEAKAAVGGKLAQLGDRLIDSTAKKLTNDFFAKFASMLSMPSKS